MGMLLLSASFKKLLASNKFCRYLVTFRMIK
jgi:hypothetical protein